MSSLPSFDRLSSSCAATGTAGLRNGHLAGSVHPKTGVPFDKAGYRTIGEGRARRRPPEQRRDVHDVQDAGSPAPKRRQYYVTHREQEAECHRRWHAAHREHVAALHRAWYVAGWYERHGFRCAGKADPKALWDAGVTALAQRTTIRA